VILEVYVGGHNFSSDEKVRAPQTESVVPKLASKESAAMEFQLDSECSDSEECCSDNCYYGILDERGTCCDLGVDGDTCNDNGNCCSGNCVDGSTCCDKAVDGDTCTDNGDCCSDNCYYDTCCSLALNGDTCGVDGDGSECCFATACYDVIEGPDLVCA
jgi:hypothetical protein